MLNPKLQKSYAMAADSKQNLKQLRVDNWAVFFLQRLQLLFAKGDCCDLTLKFVSGQELKVHRLVLSTSTSFFESMESNGNVIHLPESLPYSVVQPIINFLYSGRLEFKAELHSQLLAIAKVMKLAILARILVAQKNDNGVGDHITTPGKMDVKKLPSKPSPKKTPSPNTSFVNIIAGKKLPIWKKRTVPYRFERKPVKEEEPRPTRFEWPDEETCNNMLMASPSFSSLSYESAPVISPPVTPPSSASQSLPSTSLKRRVMPPVNSIPDKIFKPDGNAIITNDNESKNNDDQPPLSNISDDDDDDDGHFETIHTYGESDDEPDTPLESETPVSHLKPILKPMSDSPLQTPSKKVRFSFAPEDKENKNEKVAENAETPQTKSTEKTDITNHTKIIQEVLKKYPDLVKNNKNIKLKITAPGSASKQNTITIDTKKKTVQTKSSYIVLKPTVKADIVNNTPSSDIAEKSTKPTSVAENINGPWKCESCFSGNEPLKFGSYFEFRKHLQEKHLERVDSRICEYCGYKASKRNLHLYHLYTKHGVDPPKNVKFPKCSQCSYIALSESLLVKHLNSHQMAKDLTCQVCNTTFRTYSSLHVHSLSCKPNSGVRSYPCPNCKKMFKTNVSLNAHIKVCSASKEETDEGGGTQTTEEVIEVPIIETVGMNKGEHALVQIPSGLILAETPNVALLPSSESETLNNVASSIATSIGLTVALPQEHQQAVILLDGNSQFFLQGNESVVVSSENDVEEYIVPELLRDEMGQIYTTQNVPYTVTSTGVITCPIMSIESTNEIDKDKTGEGNDTSTTLNLSTDHNYAEGELKNGEELHDRTTLLESAEIHLESSNTRVEIKDSQAEDIDVVNLEKALRSPEPSELPEPEDTTMSNHISQMESENCEPNTAITTTESDLDVLNITEEQNTEASIDNIEDNIEQTTEDNVQETPVEIVEENEENIEGEQNDENIEVEENEENIEVEEKEENIEVEEKSEEEEKNEPLNEASETDGNTNEKDKAISLVRDWGFDNEEDTEDDIEDPESRPSRPTMDF